MVTTTFYVGAKIDSHSSYTSDNGKWPSRNATGQFTSLLMTTFYLGAKINSQGS